MEDVHGTGLGPRSGATIAALQAGHGYMPGGDVCEIDAWGPDRMSCIEQAVRALVDTFVQVIDVPVAQPLPILLDAGEDEAQLVGLLEEVVEVIGVLGMVPVNVALEPTREGGIAGFFDVVPIGDLPKRGPVPRSISSEGARLRPGDGGWWCRATIKR